MTSLDLKNVSFIFLLFFGLQFNSKTSANVIAQTEVNNVDNNSISSFNKSEYIHSIVDFKSNNSTKTIFNNQVLTLNNNNYYEEIIPVNQLLNNNISSDNFNQIEFNSEINSLTQSLAQINSVSQLRDVQITDWAYASLKKLVEEYDCLEGYPDRTFRGDRALTRYEFAAALHSCLDNPLMVTNNRINQKDLEIITQLMRQFELEISELNQNIDEIETRISTLEDQQFSTTTKLHGSAWINLTAVSTGENVKFEALPNTPSDQRYVGGRDGITGLPLTDTANNAEATLSSLTWLTLNTSFSSEDLLTIQLAAGNGNSPINEYTSAGFSNSYGTPYTDQTAGKITGVNEVLIQDLSYTFPISNSAKLSIAPMISWYSYFDFNKFTYYLNGASSYISANTPQSSTTFSGAGVVLDWQVSPNLTWKTGYLGENISYYSQEYGYNTASNPKYGLFGGTNSATTELTYHPNDDLNLRFRYTYSRLQGYGGQVGGGNGAPLPYGYLDAGFGYSIYDPVTNSVSDGGLDHAYAHTFAFNFDWLLSHKFGVFGRYSYGNINLEPINDQVNVQSWQVGMAFPDLGKDGALGVLTLVVPMEIQQGRKYFVSGGGDGGTMYELEASYYYPLNDNLAIVPSAYAVFNANNFNSNPNLYVGNLRMQFTF